MKIGGRSERRRSPERAPPRSGRWSALASAAAHLAILLGVWMAFPGTRDGRPAGRGTPVAITLVTTGPAIPAGAARHPTPRPRARNAAFDRPTTSQAALAPDGPRRETPVASPPAPLPETGPDPRTPSPVVNVVAVAAPQATTAARTPVVRAGLSPDEIKWQRSIMRRLVQRRHYPIQALQAGLSDEVLMRLLIDRQGYLVAASLAKSRGIKLLDDEAMALAKRASPYPIPPSAIDGDVVALLVPIDFVIAGRH